MKVKFLGVTQEQYSTTSKTQPVRLLRVTRGAIVNLPDDMVKQLQRDYPKDWEVLEAQPVREPAAASAEPQPKESNQWTRKRAATK